MTKIYCDICKSEVSDCIPVTVCNGEHPHNGSTMHSTIDVCFKCIKNLNLESRQEFNDLKEQYLKNHR